MDLTITDGLTVTENRTQKFIDLVKGGEKPAAAAEELGLSLATLRKKGVLAKACRELLDRTAEEKLLDKAKLDQLAKGRALELAMQDEDLKVALGATKALIGNAPQVAVQINNNLRTDPAVVESLRSLQLEVEGEDGE